MTVRLLLGTALTAAVLGGCADGPGEPGSPMSIPPFPPLAPKISSAELLADLEDRCGGELCVVIGWIGLPADVAPADAPCTVTGISPTGEVERGSTITVTVDCEGPG